MLKENQAKLKTSQTIIMHARVTVCIPISIITCILLYSQIMILKINGKNRLEENIFYGIKHSDIHT